MLGELHSLIRNILQFLVFRLNDKLVMQRNCIMTLIFVLVMISLQPTFAQLNLLQSKFYLNILQICEIENIVKNKIIQINVIIAKKFLILVV